LIKDYSEGCSTPEQWLPSRLAARRRARGDEQGMGVGGEGWTRVIAGHDVAVLVVQV